MRAGTATVPKKKISPVNSIEKYGRGIYLAISVWREEPRVVRLVRNHGLTALFHNKVI
jgi:hypothetical protein